MLEGLSPNYPIGLCVTRETLRHERLHALAIEARIDLDLNPIAATNMYLSLYNPSEEEKNKSVAALQALQEEIRTCLAVCNVAMLYSLTLLDGLF